MYCSHCGKEIDDNAVICVNCGVPVANRINALAPAPVTGKKLNVLGLVGMILSIVGAIGGNYFICIPSVVGLVLSIVGMCKSKECSYNGFALAGVIVGAISLFFWIIVWFVVFVELLFI